MLTILFYSLLPFLFHLSYLLFSQFLDMIRVSWFVHFDLESNIFRHLGGSHWFGLFHCQENTSIIILINDLLNFILFFTDLVLLLRLKMFGFLHFFTTIRRLDIRHVRFKKRRIHHIYILLMLDLLLLLLFLWSDGLVI